MTLETEGNSSQTDSTTTAAETTPEVSTTGYAAVDPGFSFHEAVEKEIAAIKSKNEKPSETSDDASDIDGEEEVETEGDAEETTETASGDDSVDDDISDELLDRAAALGYELDDIREFQDAKALEREISRVEKLQQRMQSRKPADESVTKPAETEPEDSEPDWEQMIEAGHDEDTVKILKRNWQRGEQATQALKQLQQAEQQRAMIAETQRFDDMLNGLPEQYESILGKGRRDDLLKSSPEVAKNRETVYVKMAVLRNAYQLSGQKVPSENDLLQEAVHASFHKQIQDFARKEIKHKIRKAGSQALSRPRSGSDRNVPNADKARMIEAAFWKSREG